MTRARIIKLLAVAVVGSLGVYAAAEVAAPATPEQADKLRQQGNWKEAFAAYSELALAKDADPDRVDHFLTSGIACLNRLSRANEIDEFREKVIAAHADNWRLLQAAAQSYLDDPHYGYMVAGKFERGHHRGGGKVVNSFERDRVRALQLMQQAIPLLPVEKDKYAAGQFFLNLSNMLLANRGWSEAWRLQYLTDLDKLPDYEDGYGYYYGGGARGAPVDEKGDPVYHYTPKSWKDAATDGQRWRWCLSQAMEYAPTRTGEVRYIFADFLHNQFGVQTMADYGWFFARQQTEEDKAKDGSGTWAVHLLGDDETIARLASGIKRFRLPDEFNFIKIFKELAEAKAYNWHPRERLATIYENRRQYPRAAEQWKLAIAEFGPGHDNYRQKRLNQIVGNWGMFENILTQPAGGKGATVEYRFRNGNKVSFEAFEIDVAKLLADVKAYLRSSPKQLDWWQVDIGNIGYRLVQQNQKQYIGKSAAKWDMDLKPRPAHVDARVTVQTPLKSAGAYLLTGKMADGNLSQVVVWIADTAIVQKPLENKTYVYVADAVVGSPIAKANVEFFGYRSEWTGGNRGRYVVHTRNFAELTDANGQVITGNVGNEAPAAGDPNAPASQPAVGVGLDTGYSWMIVATTPQGRLAYTGFNGIWYHRRHDAEYNQTKTFVITDRPVYRPGHAAKFKFWVNTAKYDQEGKSEFAGQTFTVRVNNPKGEKVFEKRFKADDYGGFDGELALDKEATLGIYSIHIPHGPGGGGSFRVEEYKKPEFEVKVDAPADPVMLGEKIAAKVTAKYYFGAPVTEAKVKYKVLRSNYSADWYPRGYWDWFYGPGYWWFAYDYAWYPGWWDWGCRRPLPIWWWDWHPRQQPEVTAEGEAAIGADGTFSIDIDTALAKAVHSHTDHKYEITAEVTDQSRRTIVGQGTVLVARKPFKVYAWVGRGHFRAGDTVHAYFQAQTLDRKPVQGTGELRLLKIAYDKDAGNKPVETVVEKWNLDTNVEGRADIQIKAAAPGQYRLSYTLTDARQHRIEGGYVFVVIGDDFKSEQYRFNDIELVPDKKEYKPGEKVDLMINTARADSTVLLFDRPTNGVYLPPKILRLKGKSVREAIAVAKRDMPNFYVEAVTVADAKVFTEAKEIVVPPESRVLDVKVDAAYADPSREQKLADTPQKKDSPLTYKPGEKAKVKFKLTDPSGEPYSGSTVVAIYDKSVEYISGGSNVPDIKEFFWKWRRHHRPNTISSLDKGSGNLVRPGDIGMSFLGVFGGSVVEELGRDYDGFGQAPQSESRSGRFFAEGPAPSAMLPSASEGAFRTSEAIPALKDYVADLAKSSNEAGGAVPGGAEPTVRTQFADTALWAAALQTNEKGEGEVELKMPENLTTWKARVWAMGQGTKVGEGATELITTKNLIVRLQAPRFFVQKDEVVLSANVHNYLKTKKSVKVVLELEGNTLVHLIQFPAAIPPGRPVPYQEGDGQSAVDVLIDPNGEKRVDWRVKVKQPGNAIVRMKAITDEESDATQQEFPVFIHGMLKTESFSGVIRPDKNESTITLKVPAERLPEQSRLEIRYSPTLAGAMVDALPYMVDYPYGCTEQTLNRFLPTVITHKVLLRMSLDLPDIRKKITNLNAQEIGDDKERAKDWSYRGGYMSRATARVQNPVFDKDEVTRMVKAGLERLGAMQCSDGGWGWFSGWGEQSYPHTTAVVVHGLQIARDNDVAVVPDMLNRGVAWLKDYQGRELQKLKNAPSRTSPWKEHADNIDALVYMVLVDEKADNKEMGEFLYRDRNHLAVYAKAMFGLALHRVGDVEKRDMLIRNIEQFLVQDDENQSAWLKLPENNWWWCWYGSEIEAHAFYLKLLCVTDPKGEKASRLVKYLINNRKHASYWNSTRDTAYAIEAFADFLKASGEDQPDMTVKILIDGREAKRVKIDASNIFSFDNKFVLVGSDVTSGEHKVQVVREGKGPVYFNAYLTNFTLEDPIRKAGLEVKVERRYFKLVPVEKKIKVAGDRGQALDQKVEKFERQELADGATLKSGDLVEVELKIDSKNDYEYLLFEDMKAAGFEPVEVRSGYGDNEMGAYMELRDERVTFFVRMLARGTHSISYRLRAEIPGKFSALPAKAAAMYAPELRANSDEAKLGVTD